MVNKTQINDLGQICPHSLSTSQDIRKIRGEKVLKENGNTLLIQIKGSNGLTVTKELHLDKSTDNKRWRYISGDVTDQEMLILGYDMRAYVNLHTANIVLYPDMHCDAMYATRKTVNQLWKIQGYIPIENSAITIL